VPAASTGYRQVKPTQVTNHIPSAATFGMHAWSKISSGRMAMTSSSNMGCIARIQHRWEVSLGHTSFRHHLGAGVLTVKAFNATKVYLGPPLIHCMQVCSFLSYVYVYGSIMFIFILFFIQRNSLVAHNS
jgi:hypothetical protein